MLQDLSNPLQSHGRLVDSSQLVNEQLPSAVDQTYTTVHRCIDQLNTTVDLRENGAFQRFQEQNRLLVQRLTSLEREALGRRSPLQSSNVGSSGELGFSLSCNATHQGARQSSDSQGSQHSRRASQYRDKLMAKFCQTWAGDVAALLDHLQTQLTRDWARLRSADTSSDAYYSLDDAPRAEQISSSSVKPPFINLIRTLAAAIEMNTFGEQTFRVKKRIALAHFYNTYTLAQEDPWTFLSWCKEAGDPLRLTSRSTVKSAVLNRFADLLLPPSTSEKRASGAEKPEDTLKARQGKIKAWRKNGKQWARLIARFDYGILLLLPESLTDEDLRIAHDDDISFVMQETGRHLQRDRGSLKFANTLVRQYLLSHDLDLPLGPFACDE